ncbi:MAG TPA: thiamine-phosphate kinase [Terriglobales bacterium]|nr:thiamine-phosphate kinase [Terriglobales bacterium]
MIARIRGQVRQSGVNLDGGIGIGDDCAVLEIPRGHEVLVTTDFSLEGVHFRRTWHPPESVGHRCLARGLSDIAAMGGEPIAAFLSLALPRNLSQSWVEKFIRGLLQLGGEAGVTLAGGDTAESPGGVLADIMVVGSAPKGKAVLRSGARPGDGIYVTGELGGAAAALRLLSQRRRVRPSDFPRHFFPVPRIKVGRFLRDRGIVSAMIDISDGLSTDLGHICDESGAGAEVEMKEVPRARIGKMAQEVDRGLALHGGEDYELLFTAAPEKHVPSSVAGVAIRRIGRIIRGRKVFLREADGRRHELPPQGWQHFK